MTQQQPGSPLIILVLLIVAFSIVATTSGIFSNDGDGRFVYTSIRNKEVLIYDKGLYKHMSAEVAPQGIAQDYVTLFLAVPVLLLSILWAIKRSLKAQYLLAGTIGYFLVPYLFYTVMGMYNKMYLVYVVLLGTSFYAFLLALQLLYRREGFLYFKPKTPAKATGIFLVSVSVAIGLLWCSIVVPPLLNGTIIPVQVEHYTTLIVQGLDLAILLPGAFICGTLLFRKKQVGYFMAPVYFIFLSLLMTALTAKVLAMFVLGYNVVPVIFIIPTFNIITMACAIIILQNITEPAFLLAK